MNVTTVPEWMPGIFDEPDATGFPQRHRPVKAHQDIWKARCGRWCFKAINQAVVLEFCQPCPGCELCPTT